LPSVQHCLTASRNAGTLAYMADIVSREVRSRMMAGIRSKDTTPEKTLRRELFAAGFRFRLHVRTMPGRPDIVLPRYQAAIFVHGCFWHQHRGCRYATTPASNAVFWQQKFADNRARDEKVLSALLAAGWRVLTVWECELSPAKAATTSADVANWIAASSSAAPPPSSTPELSGRVRRRDTVGRRSRPA
jgi:DNA mismatch endonuclease, patch repair protein